MNTLILKATTLLVQWFGPSWITNLMGYIVILGSLAGLVQEAITTMGMPTNIFEWVLLCSGVANKFSKMVGVTNSQHPAEAITVSKEIAASPNNAKPPAVQ